MDELLEQFLVESRELMAEAMRALRVLEASPSDQEAIDAAFRAVHTLKGSVALFDMAPAGRALHAAEDVLHRIRSAGLDVTDQASKALVRSLDRVDAWIDAMEATGALPPEADQEAARLEQELVGEDRSGSAEDGIGTRPAWLVALLARHHSVVEQADQPLVAFRYAPDADCFFRGDDPLALIGGHADLVELDIIDERASPDLDRLEPFHNHLSFEGLTAAALDAVLAHFRVVGGQVECHAIQPRREHVEHSAGHGANLLRIDIERVDALADDIGELVVAGNTVAALVDAVARRDPQLGAELRSAHAAIERSSASLQRRVSAIRQVPIAPAIRRLPRIVRDLTVELGKSVEFAIEGERLEVDKTIADMLFEPLLHLVRNAIDHGVETSEERVVGGKRADACIRLSFRRERGMLDVRLSDDGRGIDPNRIRQLAVERGLITSEQAGMLDPRSSIDLIFMPGFSSAATVTGISGRGVGMDAVRAALERVGARIHVESEVGTGTTMTMLFPLNAITTRMLVVRTGVDRYAVPFDRVIETATVASGRVMPLGDGEALILRGRTVALIHLAEALGGERPVSDALRLLVTQLGDDRIAVSVDGFEEQIEAQVRPAAGILAAVPGVIGTTLLGNGDVLLVLDPERLIA